MEVLDISFPKIIINIDIVGSNSLLGALCVEFQKKGYLQHTNTKGILKPDEIVFIVKKVHNGINLYSEINKVRDVLNIEEDKITVLIES